MARKKLAICIIAALIILTLIIASYEAIVWYNNYNADKFIVTLVAFNDSQGFHTSAPMQYKTGAQFEISFKVNHTQSDTIVLRTSGSASAWSYFGYPQPPYHMLSQNEMNITGASNGALIVIDIPKNATAGTYKLTMTGSNEAGRTESATYIFLV